MIFEAVAYHVDNILIMRLLSCNLVQDRTYKHLYTHPSNQFRIARIHSFAINSETNNQGLFLPGRIDGHRTLPRTVQCTFVSPDALKAWLSLYVEGYAYVNKCQPLVVDLDVIHETEEVETRLA